MLGVVLGSRVRRSWARRRGSRAASTKHVCRLSLSPGPMRRLL
jgi:hypothetical protein